MAIIAIDVFVVVVVISLSPLYPWKHRPFEALTAGPVVGHPAASACCSYQKQRPSLFSRAVNMALLFPLWI
jgi:hypothetical protein